MPHPIAGDANFIVVRRSEQTMSTLLFSFDHPESVRGWQPIDDAVMGGLSASRLSHEAEGHAVFAGEVSLANNGGFASVRSPVFAAVDSSEDGRSPTRRRSTRRVSGNSVC